MNAIIMHDAFVGTGCEGHSEPQPAVTVEAGAIWGQVYDAVTTKALPRSIRGESAWIPKTTPSTFTPRMRR